MFVFVNKNQSRHRFLEIVNLVVGGEGGELGEGKRRLKEEEKLKKQPPNSKRFLLTTLTCVRDDVSEIKCHYLVGYLPICP